ncbi:MAG: peptidoglycan recognition family protein [Eubacteriales bacterium]|nr:peptidoglycan recognition family protein [Eubacteriales bacterium]
MKQQYSQFYKNTNEQRTARREKSQKHQVKHIKNRFVTVVMCMLASFLILVAIGFSFYHFYLQWKGGSVMDDMTPSQAEPIVGAATVFPDLPITEEFLTVNRYSRPGLPLTTAPQYIVIHYTANPGSTAEQNRNYFENLKDTEETFASAQFVIGLSGEIIQCVPCNEMAYCSNSLNEYCISIEMCHPDETGSFNDDTYNNCVYLVAHLMNYYGLDMDHLIRHYDVTEKNCPKYFVEHEDRWEVFKDFVEEYRDRYRRQSK